MKKPLHSLEHLGELILDVAFPRRCLLCGAFNTWWCTTCQTALRQKSSLEVRINTDLRAWARWELSHELQHLIHGLKYRGLTELAPLFAAHMVEIVRPLCTEQSVVVPVPLHRARHRQRGYNQCALLAQSLAQLLPIAVNTTAVQKIRATQTQVGFTAAQRRENLTTAFAVVDVAALCNRDVVIVDDLCTTGSTLRSVAQTIQTAHPRSIQAVVLGYTPRGFQQQTQSDSMLFRAVSHDVL